MPFAAQEQAGSSPKWEEERGLLDLLIPPWPHIASLCPFPLCGSLSESMNLHLGHAVSTLFTSDL